MNSGEWTASRDRREPIVAIDGPAGAGKSTLAARLALRFGLLNLETGAMYRAFALKALESGVAVDDAAGLGRLSAETSIRLEPSGGEVAAGIEGHSRKDGSFKVNGSSGNRVFLDEVDVTGRIRQPDVTEAASKVSVHPAIRSWMVATQRKLGEQGGVVMEGRDIGTAVFPDAEVKIFLDASPEVRGLRRFDQLGLAGGAGPDGTAARAQDAVLREIRERDERDRTRAESPLRPAADAVVIDSSSLTFDEVAAAVERIVSERLSSEKPPGLKPGVSSPFTAG